MGQGEVTVSEPMVCGLSLFGFALVEPAAWSAFVSGGIGQRTTPFCDEDIRRVRILPSQSPQRSNLRPSEWVHRRDTVLQAIDVETTVAEVNHVPLQSNDFRDTESMPVNDQDERSVAVSVSPGLACSLHQKFDFFADQVFTWPHIGVSRLARRQLSRK